MSAGPRRRERRSVSPGPPSAWERRRASGGSSGHPLTVLVVLVLLGIGLGAWQNRASARGRESIVMTPIRAAFFPLQISMAKIQATVSDTWRSLFAGKRLAAENARLSAEIARLQTANEQLQAKAADVDMLRAALKFVESKPVEPVAAPVISWLPTQNADSITLGRGTQSGIKPKSIARTPAGLVGIVYEVGPLTSQVMLLTDSESGVGAVVRRAGKSKATGIVQGSGRGQPLAVLYLKREDDIRPGDEVFSSGQGGVVPPGIPIGKVTSVTEDKPRFLKSAIIAPAAPPVTDLRMVLLLR